MKTRILFGALIVLLLAFMFWMDLSWGGYFICVIAMVMTGFGIHELFVMARKIGIRPFTITGISFGAALLPYYLWSDALQRPLGGEAFVAFIMAPFFALVLVLMGRAVARPEGLGPQLINMAATVFGVVYVALPMAFLVLTRFLTEQTGGRHEGWDLVMLVIGVTKASDVGAYFVGTTLGRHKLAPRISPKKTVEGAVGGVIASVLVALALGYGLKIQTLIGFGPIATISFGVAVGIASQLGDLTESIIKRGTETKDSGALVPSFGGVLDLIDSFLGAAPVAYFILSIFAKITR